MTDPNKKQQEAEKKLVTQTTAGTATAITFLQGTADVVTFIQELDSIIAKLANIDLSKGNCKKVKEKEALETQDATGWKNLIKSEAFKALPGCSPLTKFILDATDELDKEKEKQNPNKIAELAISSLSEVADILFGPPRFPACAQEQLRKFLSVLPIQYYLLIALSKLAKKIADQKTLNESVSTACGERIKETKTFENRLPAFELPLIPELPYINIPSVEDAIQNILYETLCVGICVVTTPIIQKVSSVLISQANQWAESTDNDFFDNYPPLAKIPINPYLSDQAIENLFELNIASKTFVKNKDIRDFLTKTQNNPKIFQEEFIFLFLGKANCNIINNIVDQQVTKDLIKKGVKLENEEQILNFFKILGSFVNFIELINNSKMDICPPDPCDLKPDELDSVLSDIKDLCSLLDPNFGLPSLPLGSIMNKSGANDFIIDGTYSNYLNLATLFGRKIPFKLSDGKTKTVVEPYIQSQLITMSVYAPIITDNKDLQNIIKRKAARFMSLSFPFMVNRILATNDNTLSVFSSAKNLPESDSFPQGSITPPSGNLVVIRKEKFTKESLKEQLENLQKSASVSGDAGANEITAFKNLKKELGL